jgi:hypothetical protein
MDLDRLAEIVDDMAVQHDYPGYEIRSLQMGLPVEVVKSQPKLFGDALKHNNVLVRLVGLRWFWDNPGRTAPFMRVMADCLDDPDEWVRREAIRTLERASKTDEKVAARIALRLTDEATEVRKAAAKALGKLGFKSTPIIEALQKATMDSDHEVRWKAEKALRQLGAYVA